MPVGHERTKVGRRGGEEEEEELLYIAIAPDVVHFDNGKFVPILPQLQWSYNWLPSLWHKAWQS